MKAPATNLGSGGVAISSPVCAGNLPLNSDLPRSETLATLNGARESRWQHCGG